MSNLKTLKDLEKKQKITKLGFESCYDEKYQWAELPMPIIRKEDLKQEAIKWIKKIKPYRPFDEFPAFCEEYGCREKFIDWIKHFFNITEEDLK